MSKFTKKAICLGRTDPNYRKALLLTTSTSRENKKWIWKNGKMHQYINAMSSIIDTPTHQVSCIMDGWVQSLSWQRLLRGESPYFHSSILYVILGQVRCLPRKVMQLAPQGIEIGEKLLLKHDETPLKRRCHKRDYNRMVFCNEPLVLQIHIRLDGQM